MVNLNLIFRIVLGCRSRSVVFCGSGKNYFQEFQRQGHPGRRSRGGAPLVLHACPFPSRTHRTLPDGRRRRRPGGSFSFSYSFFVLGFLSELEPENERRAERGRITSS